MIQKIRVSQLSSAHRIVRNTSLAMLGNAFNQICFLFAVIAVARYLGKEAFGIYSFAMSLSFILAIVANGGLQIILIREVARNQRKAGVYLGNILLINLVLTAGILVFFSRTVDFMDLSPLKVKAVYIAISANLIHMHGRILVSTCRAFERMDFEGMLLAVQGLTYLVLALAAILVEANLLTIIGTLLVSYVVMTVLGYFLVSKNLTRPTFRVDLSLWKFLVKEAAPIGVSLFLMTSYDRIGTIALEAFRGSTEVGLFSTAFSLTRNFTFIPFVFAGAILPTFSRFAVSSRQELSLAYARAFKLSLILGLPLAVGSAVLATPIILLFFGAEFAAASNALRVVAWSIPLFFLSFTTKPALEAINKQVLWTFALIIGVLVHLVLNIALVPQMGVFGASVALLSGDIIILVVTFCLVFRELHPPIVAMAIGSLKSLASSALMGATVYYFRSHNLLLLILLGVVVYGCSLILLRVFDSQEMTLLKEVARMDKFVRWLGVTFDGKKA